MTRPLAWQRRADRRSAGECQRHGIPAASPLAEIAETRTPGAHMLVELEHPVSGPLKLLVRPSNRTVPPASSPAPPPISARTPGPCCPNCSATTKKLTPFQNGVIGGTYAARKEIEMTASASAKSTHRSNDPRCGRRCPQPGYQDLCERRHRASRRRENLGLRSRLPLGDGMGRRGLSGKWAFSMPTWTALRRLKRRVSNSA